MDVRKKILSLQEFLERKKNGKYDNKKIVFSNGCFDIVHRGHVEYLQNAGNLGDLLIIGLNTDDSVRRLKGANRPLVDQWSRAVVLSALEFVDIVIFFDEDTPLNLITKIKPHVLVKGADYKPEDIVGGKEVLSWGGEVITIPLVDGFSTTDIIGKIKKVYC